MTLVLLIGVGVITGASVALQNVINASLGQHVGSLGAVFIVALVGALLISIALVLFPRSSDLRSLPGPTQWYLYLGGLLGIFIVATPVFLVPRIGATATITAIIAGQLIMALAADQLGLFGNPKIVASLPRILGILLVAVGAYLVARN